MTSDRVVKFTRLKSRADCPEAVAYVYSIEPGINYEAKLASVRPIDPDDLDDYAVERTDYSEAALMQAFQRLIGEGTDIGKMALAKAVARECDVSQKIALGVLEKYTGENWRDHLWTVRRGLNNRRIYEPLVRTK